jgi:hypothetical protein
LVLNFTIISPLLGQAYVANIGNLTPQQYVQRYETPTGNKRIKPSNQPNIKARMPLGWRLAAQRNTISFSLLAHEKVNHPSGGALFAGAGGIAGSFDALLSGIEKTPRASGYLRKVQFFALHDIFSHLVSVRSLFNLTHADTIKNYITEEDRFALNKKAFIVGLLLTILQAQLHQLVMNYFPTLPQHLASSAGMLIMSHDYGADINFLIAEQEALFFSPTASPQATATTQNIATAMQQQYLRVLQSYISFFRSYTSYCNQPDTTNPFGVNLFFRYATNVARVLEQNPTVLQAQNVPSMPANSSDQAKRKIAALRAHTCLHPGLFFYTPESLRAIKIVPFVAQELPKNSEGLGWPSQLVNAAKSGQRAKLKDGTPLNYSVAYFKGPQGERTTSEAGAKGLFINIPTKNDLYEQEILKQPAWLNSQQGVITMMRACLGDISAVMGMNILDPCVESVIAKAQSIASSSGEQCSRRIQLIKEAHKEYAQKSTLPSEPGKQVPEEPSTQETENAGELVSS